MFFFPKNLMVRGVVKVIKVNLEHFKNIKQIEGLTIHGDGILYNFEDVPKNLSSLSFLLDKYSYCYEVGGDCVIVDDHFVKFVEGGTVKTIPTADLVKKLLGEDSFGRDSGDYREPDAAKITETLKRLIAKI